MSRIHRIISPTAPTLLAPRAGLVVLLLLGGAFALQARTKVTPVMSEQESPLPKGTVHLRRYDVDSPDGKIKAGTVDLRAIGTPVATIERAFATIQKLPANTALGYVELEVIVEPGETGGLYSFKFTGVPPVIVLRMIRSYSALAPIERKPGLLVIQRMNSFTDQAALLPNALLVDVWAGDVPADLVLEALNELEAMQPKAGIPQRVTREISPGTGKSPFIRLDIRGYDPLNVRKMVEGSISMTKP